MAKGFRIPILADVADWIKGTRKIEDSLDDVADALDGVGDDSKGLADKVEQAMKGMATDTEKAGKAGKGLESDFGKALKSVQDEAKKTGNRIGKDVKDGTDKAAEGAAEFKDEAQQSAKEAAASFSGEMDDVADYIRDLAAQAFAGWGPAGTAAGIAAAVGIGFLISGLENSADKAAEAKDRVIDLATQLAEVDGNPDAIDWAEQLKESLTEITDQKSWFEFWQDEPVTRMEEWAAAAADLEMDMNQVMRGLAGDTDAWAKTLEDLDRIIAAGDTERTKAADGYTVMDETIISASDSARDFKDKLSAQHDEFARGKELSDLMVSALEGVSTAQSESAETTAAYESAVADSLTGAGESWENYTQDGVTNLDAYNSAIENQMQSMINYEANLVTASSHLSAEALGYIKSLGPESAPLLKAFVDAPLAEKERTAKNWDTIGKAATRGYQEGNDLAGATQKKITEAQGVADGAPIRLKTEVRNDIWDQMTSLIGSLPTFTVPVRAQVSKDIP